MHAFATGVDRRDLHAAARFGNFAGRGKNNFAVFQRSSSTTHLQLGPYEAVHLTAIRPGRMAQTNPTSRANHAPRRVPEPRPLSLLFFAPAGTCTNHLTLPGPRRIRLLRIASSRGAGAFIPQRDDPRPRDQVG